jgi:predicted Zn-dependent protease
MGERSRYAAFTILALIAIMICGCKGQEATHSADITKKLSTNAALKKSWRELPIRMHVSESVPERFRDAIVDAMERWNFEAGVTLFEYAGVTDSAEQGFDEINAIYWNEELEPDGHYGKALTMSIYDNVIIEGDVVFYGDPDTFDVLSCEDATDVCKSNEFKKDITTTALHEFGHTLGFDHTNGETDIMNPHFTRGDVHHEFDATLITELGDIYKPAMIADAS